MQRLLDAASSQMPPHRATLVLEEAVSDVVLRSCGVKGDDDQVAQQEGRRFIRTDVSRLRESGVVGSIAGDSRHEKKGGR